MSHTCTKVTVRQRAIRNNRISLYLDYYPAVRNPETMQMREYAFDFDLKQLGIEGKAMVRDLWRQKDLGEVNGIFRTEVPYHLSLIHI